MTAKVFSCTVLGLNGHIVEVEADISNGLPQFNIVGLGDASVQESKERVRSSIKNCGLEFPQTRKTINLAPAQIRKQGALFDLPIALSILISSKQIPADIFDNAIVIGELSLEGKIKPVNGILPITEHAKLHGFKKIFLPAANATEASFIDGIDIFPLNSLKDLLQSTFIRHTEKFIPQPPIESIDDFTKIIGLEHAKRALQIAAAGRHNLFLIGSPGCGKTILCRALKTLISPMSKNEILETTKVFSITGLLDQTSPLITNRPFREVHHTASRVAVVGGGGAAPKPGEISLAHNGVLFLDEIAEFSRDTLESLRQPLEDKSIHLNRAGFSVKFPCDFMLAATMNPCPCGYKGDRKASCKCGENQIKHYQSKISGPLLDRFDLFLNVEKTALKKIFDEEKITQAKRELQSLKASIASTAQIQHQRGLHNSAMDLPQIRQFCRLDSATEKFLSRAVDHMNLSNRAHIRILKVARTIADLENSASINQLHLAEALQYRRAG